MSVTKARAGPHGGMALCRSQTLLCASFRSCRASLPGSEKRKCHQRGVTHHPLTSARTHVPDKGRKAQSLPIKSVLFALIDACGIKAQSLFRLNRLRQPVYPAAPRAGQGASRSLGSVVSTVNNEDTGSKQGDAGGPSHCPYLDMSRQGQVMGQEPLGDWGQ